MGSEAIERKRDQLRMGGEAREPPAATEASYGGILDRSDCACGQLRVNWTLQGIAFLPNALWFLGSKLAGDKRRLGWAILFASEFAWVGLALESQLWSMLPWCAIGFILYGRNYRKWRAA